MHDFQKPLSRTVRLQMRILRDTLSALAGMGAVSNVRASPHERKLFWSNGAYMAAQEGRHRNDDSRQRFELDKKLALDTFDVFC